ncbi:unnamed protein product [Cochlearia groenlandica]
MWKNLYLRLPSNLTKCYSSPDLPPSAVATSDDDNLGRSSVVVINKFNVNYNNVVDLPSSSITTATSTSSSATSSNESDDHHDVSPDLTAAFASRRFFFSSPGRSNSITDSPETRSRELFNNYDNATATSTKKKNKKYEAASVTTTTTTRLLEAVKRHVYSPDPITDFKRSMQEMIDAAVVAGDLTHPDKGYEFLNELLMCYLSLNPIDTHKFVIRAFSDILVSLLSDEKQRRIW